MSNSASQALPADDRNSLSAKAKDTSPGGQKEIRWQVVARTAGYTPATILAGRLQSESIPVQVWQEGAGRALGLTVGILGTGNVAVPEAYAQQAREILAQEVEAEDESSTNEEDAS